MLCEKYTHHQQYLYHIFIDFKKAFDRVWHKALWATMKNYNIDHDILRTIKGYLTIPLALYIKMERLVIGSRQLLV